MAFIRQAEDFTCAHCGAFVKGNGYTNHCPQCLWSMHVDIEPGDRAESCGGMMEPIGIEIRPKGTIIQQRCIKCGRIWKNSAAENDNAAVLIAISKMPPPGFFTVDKTAKTALEKYKQKHKNKKKKKKKVVDDVLDEEVEVEEDDT